MTAGKSKGKKEFYWYYKCGVHRKNFSAARAHQSMSEIINALSFSEQSVAYIKEKLDRSTQAYLKERGGNIMKYKLELDKVNKKIEQTQTRFLMNPDIDPEVYSRIMTDLRAEQSVIQVRLDESMADNLHLSEKINEILPRLLDLQSAFSMFTLNQKQLFLSFVFSRRLSYDGKIWTTPYIHPLFADKLVNLKELGLIKTGSESDNPPSLPAGTPGGNVGQHLGELARVFAA